MPDHYLRPLHAGPQVQRLWELDLNQLPVIDPARHGVEGESKLEARNYFATSGEAVWKMAVMQEEAAALHNRLVVRLAVAEEAERPGLLAAIAESAAAQVALAVAFNELLLARGRDVWLECEYNNRVLHVIAKNPRSREAE